MNTNPTTKHPNPFATRTQFLHEYSPIKWLVDGLISAGEVATLIGRSNTGKSFVTADLAASIATGQDFHGRTTTKAPVVYLCAEGINDMRLRLAGWEERHKKVQDDHLTLYTASSRLHSSETCKAFADDIQRLIDLGKLSGPPAAIFLDTMSRACIGADLDSATVTAELFANLHEHLQKPFGAAVVIVHHSG